MAALKNIVFFGTADFAVPALNFLVQKKFPVSLVVTQPDRPAGRGHKTTPSPIKVVAEGAKIIVVQPQKVKQDDAFRRQLEAMAVDLMIVAAYGQILPGWLLALPKIGAVNLHGSLLPKYRGAAPIQWSIIHGEKETGVTLMEMVEQLDAGNMIFQEKVSIGADETYGELSERLATVGVTLLQKFLTAVQRNETVPSIAQNTAQVTYAPLLRADDGLLDWRQSALALHNRVRGLAPRPLAYALIRGQRVKIVSTRLPADKTGPAQPGQIGIVCAKNPEALTIQTGDGQLDLLQVIPPSRNQMAASALMQIYELSVGASL